MTQAPAVIFNIPTESPQPPHGKANRAGKTAAAQPKAASRVAGIETRGATWGDGEVIELEHGITVYPPRDKGGRWRAVWHEAGERQQSACALPRVRVSTTVRGLPPRTVPWPAAG